MTLSERLELLVSMDPSNAVSAARTLATETDRSVRTAESSLQRLSAAGAKLGAGGLGVGAFLTTLGSQEQEATQQLDAAIQQVGQSLSEYSVRIDDAVASGEQFGKTESETKNALATLVAAYGDTGAALDRMQLVEDVAARRHISLSAAADIVARAHGGSTRAFKLFGVQVDQNAVGAKDYEGALDDLSRRLSGQAAASANSAAGEFRKWGAVIHDQVADIGEHYGPTILGASTVLTGLSSVAALAASAQTRLAASHATAAAAAQAQAAAESEAAAGEALVTTNSAAAVTTLYAEAAAAETVSVSLAATLGPLGLIVGGAALLGTTIGQLTDSVTVGSKGLNDYQQKLAAANGQLSATEASISALNDAIGTDTGLAKAFADAGVTSQQFVDALAGGTLASLNFKNASADEQQALLSLATATEQSAEQKVKAAVASGQLSQANLTASESTHQVAGAGVNYVAVLNELVAAGVISADVTDQQTTSTNDLAAAQKQLEQTQHAQVDSARSLYDANRAEATAHSNLVTSLRSVEDAEGRVTDAQKRLNDAMKTASADQLTKANLDISDAQQRVGDTADAVTQAQRDLDLARQRGNQFDIAAAERKLIEAQNQHERAILGVHDAEQGLQDLQAKGTAQDQAVIDAKKNLVDAEQGVVDAKGRVVDAEIAESDATLKVKTAQEQLYGGTQLATRALQDQVDVFSALAAQVDPNSPNGRLIHEYLDKLIALQSAIGTPTPTSSLTISGPGAPPRFALGGTVPGPYGKPMLAVVHGGEQVLTPEQQRARGGTGVNVTQNIYGITDPDEQQRSAARHLRRIQMLAS